MLDQIILTCWQFVCQSIRVVCPLPFPIKVVLGIFMDDVQEIMGKYGNFIRVAVDAVVKVLLC
jgi:hypothetical protein